MTGSYDIAIAGSGFAGSLMAMIAKRLGYFVALLERGTHPRMAIGESSTPLANLLLEELCRRYDLPAVAPLAKWGSWQRSHPHIGCGLKRGFTFYHHHLDEAAKAKISFEEQLLVAASPHDEISDTHWFRSDFDAFLVGQAQRLGVDYFDEAKVNQVVCHATGARLDGLRRGEAFSIDTRFLIDATGPRGLLHNALGLGESTLPHYPATQALYSQFSGVTRPATADVPESVPYPPEDAAVHHVFEGGWIWVLRFKNGITSAGVAATEPMAAHLCLDEGAIAWERLFTRIPALQSQFASADAVQPFRHMPRLSFLSSRVCGERWAMLPSAAGFVDPLLSTGFPLTLLGIERLARIFESGFDSRRLGSDLKDYEKKTTEELLATARLIAALYANMSNFELFKAVCLLYFAAASYSETARRLGKPYLAASFLLHDHPEFGPRSSELAARAMHVVSGVETNQLVEDILRAIEPVDVAGLSKANPRSWYPVDAADLFASCAKLESTQEEIEALLQRCGFYQPQQQS
ncbi:MAG: NAD(P)/FAD-dependent oxidoreductase [Terracidiphilus sp.]